MHVCTDSGGIYTLPPLVTLVCESLLVSIAAIAAADDDGTAVATASWPSFVRLLVRSKTIYNSCCLGEKSPYFRTGLPSPHPETHSLPSLLLLLHFCVFGLRCSALYPPVAIHFSRSTENYYWTVSCSHHQASSAP